MEIEINTIIMFNFMKIVVNEVVNDHIDGHLWTPFTTTKIVYGVTIYGVTFKIMTP